MSVRNEKIFDDLAWALHKRGVRPNHISFLQVPLLAALAGAAYERDLLLFAAIQIGVMLIDGADGILARRTGTTTRRGHLLDSLFDIVGIGITLWAVFYLYPQYAQWAFALLFVNFVVYIQNEIQGTKSVTYTRGPVTAGLYFQPVYPGVMVAGLVLPLTVGLVLTISRVAWRKRLWNWYQFLTAGRRREYKATPRHERAALTEPEGLMPPPRRPGP